MAFRPWRRNRQNMINNIQEEDPANSQNESATRMSRSNSVEQSDITNMNGSVSSGSVNGERASFININRLKLFGRRGSSSNSTATTHENEDEPIVSKVDCTLRLGFQTEPQEQVQLIPQGGDDDISAIVNNYFAPNNVVPKGLMQNYEVTNERTPLYHNHRQDQHINNRFVMNNLNENNYQLQQQIMNNNIVGNNGMPLGGGSPSTMNVGGNSSSRLNINNHGMFHGGGIPATMNVGGNSSSSLNINNHGMFHGGGIPATMNVGGNSSSSLNINNHGMFNGGGSPSTMNVEVNSSHVNNNLVVNNHGMFHGGGSPSTMNGRVNSSNIHNNLVSNNNLVNNHGMFNGGGIPSTMNVGVNSSNNLTVNNNGMFHGGGIPSTMNAGVNCNNNNLIVNNNGMFHGGGIPSTMNVGVNSCSNSNNLIVNNNGMFHGGGIPSTMNVGVNSCSNSNNFRMVHGGRGGGDLSSVVVALPSPGVGSLGDGLNGYNIPYPLPPPPPNNYIHVPVPNNNIPPPLQAPQLPPPVFRAAPRINLPYPRNYVPQREPEPERRCFACNTTRTPLWRNGPKGPKSLCNACGIRYKKEVRRVMAAVVAPNGGQKGDRRNKF